MPGVQQLPCVPQEFGGGSRIGPGLGKLDEIGLSEDFPAGISKSSPAKLRRQGPHQLRGRALQGTHLMGVFQVLP